MTYTIKPTANKKYTRELLRQLPKGFKIGMVEESFGGARPNKPISTRHPAVIKPDGDLLRDDQGRAVLVSGTPGSEHKRTIGNDLNRIKRALKQASD